MDWSNVTVQEVVDALKEAEWLSAPRPLPEFFAKFSAPTSFSSWTSRFKCNCYVYRTNYVILMVIFLLLGTGIIRSWLAFSGVILTCLACACLNDSFALSMNEKIIRTVRRLYPPLAAKLRSPPTPAGRSRPSRGIIYICGKDRRLVFICLLLVSIVLWLFSSTGQAILVTFLFGYLSILLHASFRTPNLKARLNTYREEFRAVWRSYSDI